MGIITLPNGIEFFSLSEELASFFELMYPIINPINIALFTLFTFVLMGLIIFFMFRFVEKGAEAI